MRKERQVEREIIQDGMGCYLKLTGEGEETVGDRMFKYQKIPGFLSMDITWINGQKQYVYDISGKVTLEQYFLDMPFGVSDVKHIFSQILALPEQLNEYLLDANGAVLQEEYLYLDVRTGELAAVYYPGLSSCGIPAIGRLLEFVMDKMTQNDEPLSFFVYGMHRLTKETGVTGQQLKQYLEKNRETVDQPIKDSRDPGTLKHLTLERPVQRVRGNRRTETDKKRKLFKGYLPPGILLLSGGLIPAFLWCLGCFAQPVSGGTDWAMVIGAVAFFGGVTGYGAWKLWPNERSIRWEEDNQREQKVCLIPCHGQEAPLPVSHFPYILGSKERHADGVIADGGASEFHARILREGEHILVMDEESERGTFCNDQRLVPWQKKHLKDGDLLRFGEREYVVEITN